MGIFLTWIIFSLVVGIIGSGRKIGFWSAFFISILLSPLIGVIFTLISKDKEEESYKKKILLTQQTQQETLNRIADTENRSSNSISKIAALEKLQKLKDDKTITDEEFKNLKNNIIKSKKIEKKEDLIKDDIEIKSSLTNDKKKEELEDLKTKLKDDEVIIMIKKNKDLKIIKQAQYESEQGFVESNSYILIHPIKEFFSL